MANPASSAAAERAAKQFTHTVDALVIERLAGLPDLGATGITSSQAGAVNHLPGKAGTEQGLGR